jgi:uncharacterized protein YgiB involved in biofilm formation
VKSNSNNSKNYINPAAQIALKKLNKLTVIGRGGFGKVYHIVNLGLESINKKNT